MRLKCRDCGNTDEFTGDQYQDITGYGRRNVEILISNGCETEEGDINDEEFHDVVVEEKHGINNIECDVCESENVIDLDEEDEEDEEEYQTDILNVKNDVMEGKS